MAAAAGRGEPASVTERHYMRIKVGPLLLVAAPEVTFDELDQFIRSKSFFRRDKLAGVVHSYVDIKSPNSALVFKVCKDANKNEGQCYNSERHWTFLSWKATMISTVQKGDCLEYYYGSGPTFDNKSVISIDIQHTRVAYNSMLQQEGFTVVDDERRVVIPYDYATFTVSVDAHFVALQRYIMSGLGTVSIGRAIRRNDYFPMVILEGGLIQWQGFQMNENNFNHALSDVETFLREKYGMQVDMRVIQLSVHYRRMWTFLTRMTRYNHIVMGGNVNSIRLIIFKTKSHQILYDSNSHATIITSLSQAFNIVESQV